MLKEYTTELELYNIVRLVMDLKTDGVPPLKQSF